MCVCVSSAVIESVWKYSKTAIGNSPNDYMLFILPQFVSWWMLPHSKVASIHLLLPWDRCQPRPAFRKYMLSSDHWCHLVQPMRRVVGLLFDYNRSLRWPSSGKKKKLTNSMQYYWFILNQTIGLFTWASASTFSNEFVRQVSNKFSMASVRTTPAISSTSDDLMQLIPPFFKRAEYCKYVIARLRSPSEHEINVSNAFNLQNRDFFCLS